MSSSVTSSILLRILIIVTWFNGGTSAARICQTCTRLARDIMTIPGKCLALLDVVLIAYPFPIRFCCLCGAYIFIWQGFGLFETFQIAPRDNSDLDVCYDFIFLSKRLLSYLIFGAYLIFRSATPGSLQRHTPLKHHILGYRVFALFIF